MIEKVKQKDEIHLKPKITLEQLAEKVKLSPRQVSTIINPHFKKAVSSLLTIAK